MTLPAKKPPPPRLASLVPSDLTAKVQARPSPGGANPSKAPERSPAPPPRSQFGTDSSEDSWLRRTADSALNFVKKSMAAPNSPAMASLDIFAEPGAPPAPVVATADAQKIATSKKNYAPTWAQQDKKGDFDDGVYSRFNTVLGEYKTESAQQEKQFAAKKSKYVAMEAPDGSVIYVPKTSTFMVVFLRIVKAVLSLVLIAATIYTVRYLKHRPKMPAMTKGMRTFIEKANQRDTPPVEKD